MANLIAFDDPSHPNQKIWIHPDAVEQVKSVGNGNSSIIFRSGSSPIYVSGEPEFVAAKLNSASD